ncbi:MAG: glycine oxidase ThiO [Candidatus Omnitrophica bacterium]|nr:glycine oxidase ThiO [Candidatus Omnitrophota bacterium]
MRHSQILILGGGIIGTALAEELARRGKHVTLIERSTVGAEASSAAAGILASQVDLVEPGPLFDLCQQGRAMYPAWVARLERASGISVGYHKDGILYIARTASEERVMQRRIRWQQTLGVRVKVWSPAQVRRHEPAIDADICRGFFFPDDAQVDNAVLMQALARACRVAGVSVREHTTVRRLLVRQGVVRGVDTDRGRMEAPVVVNCLGSWAPLGGRFPVPVPVEPVRGQILVFRGPRGLLRHSVMTEHGYMVQRRDGRILLGSTVEHVGYDKSLTVEGMHKILSGLRRFSSAINHCTFVESWAGLRPYSRTHQPVMGPTRIAGLYLATGHFRHGILLAPVTAHVITELLLHRRSS